MGRIASIPGKAKPKSPLPSRLLLRAKSFPKTGREPWEAGSRLWIKGPLDRGVPAQKGPQARFEHNPRLGAIRGGEATRRGSPGGNRRYAAQALSRMSSVAFSSKRVQPGGVSLFFEEKPDIGAAWADAPGSFAGRLSLR